MCVSINGVSFKLSCDLLYLTLLPSFISSKCSLHTNDMLWLGLTGWWRVQVSFLTCNFNPWRTPHGLHNNQKLTKRLNLSFCEFSGYSQPFLSPFLSIESIHQSRRWYCGKRNPKINAAIQIFSCTFLIQASQAALLLWTVLSSILPS